MRDQKAWDEVKIRNTFKIIDAVAILAIRIP